MSIYSFTKVESLEQKIERLRASSSKPNRIFAMSVLLCSTMFLASTSTVLAGGAVASMERNPYIETVPASDEPLTVIFSFLSRSDNTPLSQRSRAPHNMLDVNGNLIDDPATDTDENGFEANPNIGFEKWGYYWRKVHGVRFTYTEDPADTSLKNLLRYDQLHRSPGGPTSAVPLPYTAPADDNNKLYSTVIGHIPEYQRPKFDGVAYLQFKDIPGLAATFSSDKFQTKIVPEDHAIFREVAPLLSSQYIIIPSEDGRDAVSIVYAHVRTNGISREEFQKWWLNEQADLISNDPATKRYVKSYTQLHNIGSIVEGEPFYNHYTSGIDGVSVFGFASMNDAEDYILASNNHGMALAAGTNTDATKSEFWTSVNYNVVTRVFPQPATIRP